MGLLSTNIKAELGRGTASVVPVLTMTLADGTAYRVCGIEGPIASASLGFFEPRVRSWGRWPRPLSGRDGDLRGATGTIVLDDTDLSVSAKAYKMRGSAVTLKLASLSLAAADYFTYFTGIVSAVVRRGAEWEVQLRTDDAWLLGDVPKATFTSSAWPSLHSSALGKPIPIIYGTHDATGGLGSNGMVPAYYVDTATFRFAIAGHYLKAVRRAYLNGIGLIPTTDYLVQHPIVGGRQYTAIQLFADPGSNPVVTCDVDGIEDVGDGTGALITNPATQLKHFLVNFVNGDYQRGAWALDSTAAVDTTHFTTAAGFFTAMNFRGSRWIGEQTRSGAAELQQWCRDLETSCFWANSGKLGVLPFDPRTQNAGVYPADRIIESVDVMRGEISTVFDSEAFVARIQTRYVPRSVDGQFLYEREDRDATSTLKAPFVKEARWFPAEIGYYPEARDCAARRINRYRSLLPMLECTLRPAYLDYELLSDFGVTWAAGLSEDGTTGWGDKTWQRRLFRLVSTELDLDTMELRALLEDLHPVLTSFHGVWKVKRTTGADQDWSYLLNVLGSTLSFSRASKKWVNDPGGTLVLEYAAAALPADATGFLIEEASTNDFLHSAFDGGTLGWTLNPFNGTIAQDLVDVIFPDTQRVVTDGAITAAAAILTTSWTAADGTTVAGSATLTKAAGRFTAADVGKAITITGAGPGGATLTTTITAFSSATSVTIATPATVAVAGTATITINAGATNFTAADVGRVVSVAGAGAAGVPLVTTISVFTSGTQVTLAANAATTVTGANATVYTTASIKITAPAGAPTGNIVISQVTASYPANTRFSVSVDHKDDTGQQLSVFLQRAFDGFFWNEGTRTWGVAGVANKLTLSQTAPGRHDVRNIDIGANASTLTVFVGIDSATAAANQSHHVYCAQPERLRWPSSRISTGTATVTRAAETLLCANDGQQSKKVWPNTRGTIGIFNATPLWQPADLVAGSLMYLLDLQYDANNRWEVFYDKDAALWKFRLTCAGVAFTATCAGTPVKGVAQQIAVRWTSSDAELGLAAGTASILVNGVKGTDAVFTTPPTEAAGASVYMGGKTGGTMTNQWNGSIEGVRISPFCLSDGVINARVALPV